MSLKILKQVELMRKMYPGFRVLNRTSCFALWEGKLRPLSQEYTVQVAYWRKPKKGDEVCPRFPLVTVLNPLLRRREENPEEPFPHHYANRRCPEQPILCLHDPDTDEWHPRKSIAQTIIPWTIDWLACYEGWLATGEWTGGGRHPTSQ